MSDKERFKAFIAVYLVLIKDKKILLLRRKDTGYQDGNYSLVAGHLDGGERTRVSMAREALEEAGITILPDDLEVVHIMHHFRPEREYFDIYLKADKWEGEVCNMEEHKCDDLSWFDLNSLPDNLIPEVRQALENIKTNDFYSEFGFEE